ncbi:MAG: divalent metal cation transporter, partial [Nakamurella sp.]
TSVGSYAGGVIMEGLLARRVNPMLRRGITLIPALAVLAVGANPTTVLVISQVVLSFGLPFVLVPLMRLTSNPTVMGVDVNRGAIKVAGWVIISAIVALNAVLIVSVFSKL